MITFEPVFERLVALIRGAIVMIPNLLVALILFAIFMVVAGVIRRWGERVALRAGVEQGGSLVLGRMARRHSSGSSWFSTKVVSMPSLARVYLKRL